jgi:hypothetical protein
VINREGAITEDADLNVVTLRQLQRLTAFVAN